jgi:hypothetical protein
LDGLTVTELLSADNVDTFKAELSAELTDALSVASGTITVTEVVPQDSTILVTVNIQADTDTDAVSLGDDILESVDNNRFAAAKWMSSVTADTFVVKCTDGSFEAECPTVGDDDGGDDDGEESDDDSGGSPVGGIVGGLMAVIIIGGAVYYWFKIRGKDKVQGQPAAQVDAVADPPPV